MLVTKAETVQIELMRRAGPRRRAAFALQLSDEMIALSRRSIERNYPHLDSVRQRLKFVELQYGRELAARVERWLVARGKLR